MEKWIFIKDFKCLIVFRFVICGDNLMLLIGIYLSDEVDRIIIY